MQQLNVISAVMAGFAAYFWYRSATVKTPSDFQTKERGSISMARMSEELAALGHGVFQQSRLSATAAKCASASAAAQTLVALLP